MIGYRPFEQKLKIENIKLVQTELKLINWGTISNLWKSFGQFQNKLFSNRYKMRYFKVQCF